MPAAPMTDPGTRPMTPGVRAGLVAIASVIFWLGLSLFVFPSETATLFAWTIQPPLTAAFLGASYWASTTLAATCALERDWVRGRAFAAPYLIAGVVLLVVTLVHIDRFHMDAVTGLGVARAVRDLPARGRAAAARGSSGRRGRSRSARTPMPRAAARGDRRVRGRAVRDRHGARHRARSTPRRCGRGRSRR